MEPCDAVKQRFTKRRAGMFDDQALKVPSFNAQPFTVLTQKALCFGAPMFGRQRPGRQTLQIHAVICQAAPNIAHSIDRVSV